jgi:hypothetical protein
VHRYFPDTLSTNLLVGSRCFSLLHPFDAEF